MGGTIGFVSTGTWEGTLKGARTGALHGAAGGFSHGFLSSARVPKQVARQIDSAKNAELPVIQECFVAGTPVLVASDAESVFTITSAVEPSELRAASSSIIAGLGWEETVGAAVIAAGLAAGAAIQNKRSRSRQEEHESAIDELMAAFDDALDESWFGDTEQERQQFAWA